jgi:hypothetical protein
MPDTKKIKKGRGPTNRMDRSHLRRGATDVDMKVSVVQQKEISKQKSRKKTQRKNSNKHRVRNNSAPARIGQPVNIIQTDFLKEGKMKLNRLFYGSIANEQMSYENYELLKKNIVSEYANIQLQQQKEIMRLSRDLRIVEQAKDKYLKKINDLQDKLQQDQGTTGIQDILSGLAQLNHNGQ